MDIKAEILDYINCNETTGTLLLTGPWGCGKSYLVKQIANELNEENSAAVAVISLFGLEGISAINKRVKDEYTNFDLGTVGKAIKKFPQVWQPLQKMDWQSRELRLQAPWDYRQLRKGLLL